MSLLQLGSWSPRRILWTIGIGGVGLYLACIGVADWYIGVRSKTWPATIGRVLESTVERVPGHGRVAPGYTADVRYRYEVAGHTYLGDRTSLGRLSLGTGESAAESLVRQYPAGTAVEVHYDPARPGESVLQVGWTWSAVVRTSLGIALLVLCSFLDGDAMPQPNLRLKLSGRRRRFCRNAQWKPSFLTAAPAPRSLSAIR